MSEEHPFKLPKTQEARAVCQHESAHAVVALSLSHRVKGIQIVASEELGIYGQTMAQDVSTREVYDPVVIWEDLLVTLAGPVLDAEAGRTHPGSLVDIERANSLATLMALLDGNTVHDQIKKAQRQVSHILDINSELVFGLCDLLMASEDGSLSEEEIYELIREEN